MTPTWETMWFPHAFVGVMEQLQHAVATGTPPALSVADNVKTVALIEAGYRSIAERRTVRLSEIAIRLNKDNRGGTNAMMQAGIFTGYFPYGLEETAKQASAGSGSTPCSSTCTSRTST